MTLIALLSARENARARTAAGAAGPLIEFGGRPLVEFQARMAIAAGAEHVLIQVDSISPDLARLVDHLTADRQASIALVQDMATLSRSLVPDDRLILIAENLLLPPETLTALIGAPAPAMLTLPAVPSTTGFERIDSTTAWAGALLLTGTQVIDTVDMLGEWDLGLTLMRRSVQIGAGRVPLSPELVMDGRLTLVRDQESADLAFGLLADQGKSRPSGEGSGLGRLLAPIGRGLVRELVRRQIEPARVEAVALLLGVGALALGSGGFPILALLVMLLAQGLADLARQCADVTFRATPSPWRSRIAPGLGLALLTVIGWRLGQGQLLALSGAWLPLILTGLLAFLPAPEEDALGLWRPWLRLTVPLASLIILLGLMLGAGEAAFALLGLLATAIIGLRLFAKKG